MSGKLGLLTLVTTAFFAFLMMFFLLSALDGATVRIGAFHEWKTQMEKPSESKDGRQQLTPNRLYLDSTGLA